MERNEREKIARNILDELYDKNYEIFSSLWQADNSIYQNENFHIWFTLFGGITIKSGQFYAMIINYFDIYVELDAVRIITAYLISLIYVFLLPLFAFPTFVIIFRFVPCLSYLISPLLAQFPLAHYYYHSIHPPYFFILSIYLSFFARSSFLKQLPARLFDQRNAFIIRLNYLCSPVFHSSAPHTTGQ